MYLGFNGLRLPHTTLLRLSELKVKINTTNPKSGLREQELLDLRETHAKKSIKKSICLLGDMAKKNIAVFISGSGTNLQAIIDRWKKGYFRNATIACVLSNKADAHGLDRAVKAKIPAIVVSHNEFSSREEHEKEIEKVLAKYHIDLIVLAGYMRLMSPEFVKKWKYRIINIHPALLPSFAGTDGYGDAFNYGVKVSGITIHFVDEGCDTGPIIYQESFPIGPKDTKESVKERGLKIEHRAYPYVIKMLTEKRWKVQGRKVVM